MNNRNKTQRKNAILGALVADAASLGLHWLYLAARADDVAGIPIGLTDVLRECTAQDHDQKTDDPKHEGDRVDLDHPLRG